jgi:hypothetical protein
MRLAPNLMARAALASLAFAVPLAGPATTTAQGRARIAPAKIVDLPVSFAVQNINRSLVPCLADGSNVRLVGRLVGPRSIIAAARTPATVTLYLHEFSFGKWFWHFPDRAYDYATFQARAGHVSVLVDRLGYGDSSHPNGNATCVGADADEEHQMAMQLRAGSYQLGGAPARGFQHVVVAGHSGGAMASEIEAYSFGDVDGLMIFAHVDGDPTNRGTTEGLQEGGVCALGGQPSEPGGPSGYAYFGQTEADWRIDYFEGAERRIVDAAVPLRHRDPCGDVYSFAEAVFLDHIYVPRIAVPVLLLYGLSDALFAQPAGGRDQRAEFSGSRDVTLDYFAGCGHALNLELCAPDVRRRVSDWLGRRGLG